MEKREDLIRQEMKPIEFVRFLYWSLLDRNGGIKSPEDFDSDFYFLLRKSNFSDSEDRVNFCIQLVSWLMKSDYLNSTTKEFIKFNGGCGMRTFFENRNRKISRYNLYRDENEIEIPIENINTLVSRVSSDTNRLLMIFDKEVYNNLFIEEEPSYWKVYKRNFLSKASKSSYMTIDLGNFGFDIPYDKIVTTPPNDSEYREMLNVVSMYSISNRDKILGLIDNSCWGYLLYLCSCEPQKKKDKENYKLLQEVINGTYQEISKEIIESSETVNREKELDNLEKSLNIKEIELDNKLLDIERREKELEMMNKDSGNNDAILKKVVEKMDEIVKGPQDKCYDSLSKFVQLLKERGL